jgi:phosphoglycolate phosphatase-like HAD superfamily hydrolase
MRQFGGDTTIPRDVRLILMDCFETLLELNERNAYAPRLGIGEFLQHFVRDRGVPVAVISDAAEDLIVAALKQAGIRHLVRGVYHSINASEALGDGRQRKRLDVPLREFGVPPAQAVYIGDSPFDAQAAQHHGLPFIRVPRSEDLGFNFASLITGPSRYRSADFTSVMLDRYRDKGPR